MLFREFPAGVAPRCRQHLAATEDESRIGFCSPATSLEYCSYTSHAGLLLPRQPELRADVAADEVGVQDEVAAAVIGVRADADAPRVALVAERRADRAGRGIAFAEEMLRVSPMGLRMTKQALNTLIDAPSLDAALMIEDRQQVILLETADHAEAVAAFRERREPTYSDQ